MSVHSDEYQENRLDQDFLGKFHPNRQLLVQR